MFRGNIQHRLDGSNLALPNAGKVAGVRGQKFLFIQNGPLGQRDKFPLIIKVQVSHSDEIRSTVRAIQSTFTLQSNKPPQFQFKRRYVERGQYFEIHGDTVLAGNQQNQYIFPRSRVSRLSAIMYMIVTEDVNTTMHEWRHLR